MVLRTSSVEPLNYCSISGIQQENRIDQRFAIFFWAVSTTDLRVEITSSGLSAPKMAVPATMTLLPAMLPQLRCCFVGAEIKLGLTCLGTDVDRLGTHASIHLDVFIREPCTELGDLGDAALDEFLPATSWEGTFPIQSAVMKLVRKQNIPGYTVMTRSISASSPTSSDIEVDGVSGDIATPAFMFLSWMECIREMGSAAMDRVSIRDLQLAREGKGD
jgi:hypothetical protein